MLPTTNMDQQVDARGVSVGRWQLVKSIAVIFTFAGVLLNFSYSVVGLVVKTAEHKSAVCVADVASSIRSSLAVVLLWLAPIFVASVVLLLVSRGKLRAKERSE